ALTAQCVRSSCRLPRDSTLFPYTTLFRSARQPSLDVVGLARTKAHVTGAEHDGAEWDAEALENGLGALGHALMLGDRRFGVGDRSEEHTSELQSRENLVCRLLLEKKKRDV